MSTQKIENRCIYCPSSGPFSDEHMIPAGLGADDKRFLLRNMVCKVCNTTIFSPLEREFLRSSPTAIGRIFLQAEGRKRGNKKKPPQLGAGAKVLITPEGLTAETEIGYKGKPTLLPQLILVDDRKCSFSGSGKEEFSAFISQVRELLGRSVACARKTAEIGPHEFQITTFVWTDDEYLEYEQTVASELPDICLLHLPIESDANGKYDSNTRLFRRSGGQVVLRLRSDLSPDRALTTFRKVAEQIDLAEVQESEMQQPVVSVRLCFQLDVTGRVLAKTGLNMLAHLFGAGYVGHPEFLKIKNAIKTGEPVIASHTEEAKAPFRALFSGLPDTYHGFLLAAHPWSGETCGIGLVAKLYGSQIEVVKLGHGLPFPQISLPIVFTVEYGTHRIQQYSLMEYMLKYPINAPFP